MSLLDDVCFASSFSFKYSQRPGTPALRLLKDEVPLEVAQARLERLQRRQRDISKAMNAAMAGPPSMSWSRVRVDTTRA